MGDSSLQTTQYECNRKMYEPSFDCDVEVHGTYPGLRSGLGRLKLLFLQFANDLRDSALISKLHAHLRKMANKVDNIDYKVNDIHYKVNGTHYKVDDIHTILCKVNGSGSQPVSDTLSRQEIPLKPEIFHGRDDMVKGIAKMLLEEKTSRICILGTGGMGKTSATLAVVELPRYLGTSR